MAEAVLFNVAGSILKTLGSPALKEIGLLWGTKDEMKKLKDTVHLIRSVLLDAEKKYEMSNEIKAWLNLLKEVVYDVDDFLDDISTNTLRRQLISDNVVTKEVKLFFSSSNRLAYSIKVAHKIKDLRARLEDVKENRKFILANNHVESTLVGLCRDTHSSLPNVIIGRESDKKKVISHLLANHEEKVVVLPIVGLGGMGKTTLAQMVYNDDTVKEIFKLRVWVCVSDAFDIKSIFRKMIECIDGGTQNTNLEMEVLKIQLHKRIDMEKYLIVLDDVWNEDREKWVQFYDMIVGGATGGRIIITTRSEVVADITCTSLTHELKGLCESESWDLFHGVAFKKGQSHDEVFDKLGKEIVTKCHGLPLAITTIGSFLYSKTKESEWRHFKDEEFSKLDSKAKINIIEILKLSYNHLPSNLKHCFAYCSLFPKDYIYDVHALTSYWKSQGYVDSENENMFSGLNCLKYLVQRYFLQIESKGEDEEIVKCKMHDFMHDLAMLVAGDEVKVLIPENASGISVPENIRHISLHHVSRFIKWQDVDPLFNQKKTRTLIVMSKDEDILKSVADLYMNGEGLLTLSSKLTYLRVLVMCGIQFKMFPQTFYKLKHLRQLDLSWNFRLEVLPNSITLLVNLEVLNLEMCEFLEKIPKNMKKLVNLVQLELNGCGRLKEMPQGIGELTSLEVLSRFSLPKEGEGGSLDELQNLTKLRGKLTLSNLKYVKRGADECKAANLKGKEHLRTLILDWSHNFGPKKEREVDMNIQEKSLEALQPHVNIRQLELHHYEGERFPSWVSSLENLETLKIHNCESLVSLPEEIGRLTSLNHLEIYKCGKLFKRCWSCEGEDWHLISHIPNININQIWVQRDGR